MIINVENISKAYRIGLKEKEHDSLASAVVSWIKSPLRNFKKLRSLSNIQTNDISDDIIWALKDVSFKVNEGEVLGIIGKNGAGKSTLLKIIAGITEPTKGRIEIYGRIASLLEVGTGFNPELTGRENIYLNGTILGMTKKEIDRKFDSIIDFSGVEKFIDTPIKRYSSGMKVRLAFAVAAFLEPEILIIDEVLAVGDAEFQKKCLGKMGDITSREGRTILFVSHNMAAVKSLCSKILLLRNQHGTYYENPLDGVENYFRTFKKSDDDINLNNEVISFGNIKINGGRELDIPFTDELKIQTRIFTKYDIENFRLFFLIESAETETIICKEISSANFPAIKGKGSYSIELRLPPLWLTPGLYTAYFKILPVGINLPKRVLSEKLLINCVNTNYSHNFISVLEPKSYWEINEIL